MPKTTTSAMDAHLAEEVTNLASAWLITRRDGMQFRFTTSSEDITIDVGDGLGEQTYFAEEGYSRSNFSNDADLSVGNLDLVGIFDNQQLDETELRRGLFDFADVKIFYFNWDDTSAAMGIIRIMRGTLGETIVTPDGFFQVTLRDLTTVFSRKLGKKISKDCRADLGDDICLVPVNPDFIPRNTAVALGDFYKVSDEFGGVSLLVPFEDEQGNATPDDQGTSGFTGTLGSLASITDVDPLTGSRSLLLPSTASQNPSNAFVSYPDDPSLSMDVQEFTLEARIMFSDLTNSIQVILSKYLNTGNEREYFLRRNGDTLEFVFSTNGSDATTITGAFVWSADTEYHVAVCRDSSDDFRLFVDGTQVGSTTNNSSTLFSGDSVFYIGKLRSAGFDDRSFVGRIDEVRVSKGVARYTANFTPEEPFRTAGDLLTEDFNGVIFEVTTAGTTDVVQPVYDETINNTTNDGTAVLTARHAWARAAEVTAVDVQETRRTFTVTELTPNSGHTITGATPATLGFPDDWFNGGWVVFESGDNDGISMEIRDFTADDGITIEQIVELFSDLPFDIQVGDKLRIIPGCDKTLNTCVTKFNNARRMEGEPYVPGGDVLGQYPDAR